MPRSAASSVARRPLQVEAHDSDGLAIERADLHFSVEPAGLRCVAASDGVTITLANDTLTFAVSFDLTKYVLKNVYDLFVTDVTANAVFQRFDAIGNGTLTRLAPNAQLLASSSEAFLLAQDEPGHVVNTASVAGLVNPQMMAVYNVSKHAVVSLSETLYYDLRMVNAKVGGSVLFPAFVPTGLHSPDRHRPVP